MLAFIAEVTQRIDELICRVRDSQSKGCPRCNLLRP